MSPVLNELLSQLSLLDLPTLNGFIHIDWYPASFLVAFVVCDSELFLLLCGLYIEDLVQDCGNCNALVMELPQSHNKPLVSYMVESYFLKAHWALRCFLP